MPDEPPYRFGGFTLPQYTQVPDQLFDELLPRLSESELKVLLYIIRRTFGFKKPSDNISLKQLVEGITTRDGRKLDHGAGVSKSSAVRGVNGLIEKNIIKAKRNRSGDKGDQPTTYSLVMPPVSQIETRGDVNLGQAGVPDLDPQETVEQERDETKPFEDSKSPTPIFNEERDAIGAVMRDFARQLGDNAPLPSTTSRAYNIYRHAGITLEDFIDILYEARRITQERSAAIRAKGNQRGFGTKTKMPYFFSVVEDLLRK